jgi:hypothetical protein
MKKALLICGALLALTAGAASAGVNLSFGECGAAGAQFSALTCTNNGGASLILVISATPSSDIGQALTQETVIDLATSAATISPWWDMRASGGCRPTSASVTFSFGSLSACSDPWSGQALGGYDYGIAPLQDVTNGSQLNRARIRTVCALPAFAPVLLSGGTEYYMCEVIINKQKTVGLGSCAGCTDDATFFLNSVKISQPDGADGGNPTFVSADNNSCARTRSAPSASQCNATPNANRTWGSVKALYR